ncbi:kinase-like domain-containing protein [Cubamyces lactineus]|nr:kinase-like domain-containing protein [Cubamyces lactineus]
MFSARHLVGRLCVFTQRRPRSPSPPRPFSTIDYPIIDPDVLVEEERLPWYDPRDFYPVRIGQVFKSRYQVVGKLGYGGYSTVWLCRDLMEHRYATVKVFSQLSIEPFQRELGAFRYLNSLAKTDHFGRECIRTSLDHFELPVDPAISSQPFQCLVFEPAAKSIWDVRQRAQGKLFPENVVKAIVRHVLFGLDYLHQEAKMVHTDIQEKNVLLPMTDFEVLRAFEDAERANPLPRKVVGDRNIYLSRAIDCMAYEHPVLSDFGEARFGRAKYTGLIQPIPYRAPEVILGMPWDEKVDICSLGTMVQAVARSGDHQLRPGSRRNGRHHIAHMVSLLGLPPVDFLKRSETGEPWKCFDTQGHWTGATTLPDDSLELLLDHRLEGENKVLFLGFVRKMLKWTPEERHAAHELLEDPWLNTP